ncbi:hypothetical protein PM082_019722 [Marasmius tenuissimus]|nr:hypothetical protein PM082_019722 [Marasmius tenuissimus]
MTSNFFLGAKNTRIGKNSVFQHVEGDVNHNYIGCPTCQEREEDRIMPKQRRYREIYEGDIFLREQTWSREIEVAIRAPLTDNRSCRNGRQTRIVVVKKFHTATMYPHNHTVTVVSFEPKGKRNRDTTRLLWDEFYQAYSAHRTPRVVQMLGLMTAEMPTFVLYEELVNGYKFIGPHNARSIVFRYIQYTLDLAVSVLRGDESLRIPVSGEWWDWTFNLKTRTWHYDACANIKQLTEYSQYAPTPLPEGPLPQLDADSITTYFENTFGDLLYLIASLGGTNRRDLSNHARYGRLTFGAVVKRWRRGILAHFPCIPRPEWCFVNRSHNIDVSYSRKVAARVEFQLCDTRDAQLHLHFSLRLPLRDRNRLRAAYLCQSKKDSTLSTFFIDEIGFSVAGNLAGTSGAYPTPVYLFVPPLHIEYIDGMCCIPDPLPGPIFYWSLDPKGKATIPEQNWDQYGIPHLTVETWLGSHWSSGYRVVDNHMRNKNYEPDGKQYARDYGYPELIWGGYQRMMFLFSPFLLVSFDAWYT